MIKNNLIEEINSLINNLHSYNDFYFEIDISFINKLYHYDKIIIKNNFNHTTYISFKENNSPKIILNDNSFYSLPIITLFYILTQLKNIFIQEKELLIKDRKDYLYNTIIKNIHSDKNTTRYCVDLQVSKDLYFSFELMYKFVTTEAYFKNYILMKNQTYQYY